MADTYTLDRDTIVGRLRVLVGDTDVSDGANTSMLPNEDYTIFNSLAGGNLFLGASLALLALGSSTPAISFEAGDISVDRKMLVAERRRLAKEYRELAYSTPAEFVDSYLVNIDKAGVDWTEYLNSPDIF